MTRRKSKPITATITEERILQLSNDEAEGIRSGTVEEWRAVAAYFKDEVCRQATHLGTVRTSVAALVTGREMIRYSDAELRQWLEQQDA